jgi:hypothetical protein
MLSQGLKIILIELEQLVVHIEGPSIFIEGQQETRLVKESLDMVIIEGEGLVIISDGFMKAIQTGAACSGAHKEKIVLRLELQGLSHPVEGIIVETVNGIELPFEIKLVMIVAAIASLPYELFAAENGLIPAFDTIECFAELNIVHTMKISSTGMGARSDQHIGKSIVYSKA